MQIEGKNQLNSGRKGRERRWAIMAGGAVVTVSLAAGGVWLLRHRGNQKPVPAAPTPTVAAARIPGNAPTAATSNASTDLEIDLTADDLKKARIQTARVIQRAVETSLRVPGIVKLDEYRVVHVTPVADGIVRQVPVLLGAHVSTGQPLAVVFSSELADAQTQYLAYAAELEAEHKKLQRTENLVRIGAASRQEEEEVSASHIAHEAHVRASLERLKLLGAGDRQVAALKQAGQFDSNFTIPSPISGLVLARTANVGLVINKSQELFTVADLSRVWVMASLNEKDFSSVRVGSVGHITTPAYRERTWSGRVAYIDPQVDPATRTAQARIEVANPGESLRIQMYVDVDFASRGSAGIAVPETAVQSIGDRKFVFLPIKDNEGGFAIHMVRLGPAVDKFYTVLEGLKPNDEVVTSGSFILKAEGVRQHPELQ